MFLSTVMHLIQDGSHLSPSESWDGLQLNLSEPQQEQVGLEYDQANERFPSMQIELKGWTYAFVFVKCSIYLGSVVQVGTISEKFTQAILNLFWLTLHVTHSLHESLSVCGFHSLCTFIVSISRGKYASISTI